MSAMDVDAKLNMPLDDLIRQTKTERRRAPKKGFVPTPAAAWTQDGSGDAVMGGTGAGKATRRRGAKKRLGADRAAVPSSAGLSTKGLANRRNRRGGARGNAMDVDVAGDAQGNWSHDKFAEANPGVRVRAAGGRGRSIVSRLGQSVEASKARAGTKLHVRNLHPNVKQADVFALFSTLGSVKSAKLNVDESGLSLGTAEVVFASRDEADTAMLLNNRLFDGQPMIIKRADDTPAAVKPKKPAGNPASRLFSSSLIAATSQKQKGDLRSRLGVANGGSGSGSGIGPLALSTNALRSQRGRKQQGDVTFTVRLK